MIYFIDSDGGQATLLVGPHGQSVLFDAGSAGKKTAELIRAAAKDARIKKINFLLATDFHPNNIGGVLELLKSVPVTALVDRGPDSGNFENGEAYAAYEKLIRKAPHLTMRPGDGLPIKDLMVQVLTANGERIDHPLPNAGTANLWCEDEPAPPAEKSESSRSIGTLITYGKFRLLDLGDLSRQRELELACPNNMIGKIDLFFVTHEGAAGSNAKALDWGLHPRVAIVENAAQGNDPAAWRVVRNSPNLEDFWQLRFAADLGRDQNAADPFIANLDGSGGHYIKVSANPDGSFTVWNSRNRFKKYYARPQMPRAEP